MSDSGTPSLSRTVMPLGSLYISRMLGLFMVLPVLTLSGGDYSESTVTLLGIALGVYGLTQAVLQIPFGILSDRFGRKPLIIFGLLIFACGSVIAATAESVWGLILGRALQGAGAIAGVIMAMVADLTSEENRTKAMATIGASIGMAFALSIVIGPLLMNFGGIRSIFWVTLALAVVGIAIILWWVPQVPKADVKPILSLQSLSSVVSDPTLLRLNVGVFCLHAVLTAIFVVVPLLLEQALLVRDHHGWVYLGVMLVSFMVMIPLIIIGEKKRKVKPIFLSILIVAFVGLLGLALSQNLVLILFMLLLFFIAFNYLEASLPSLMSKTVAPEQRGAGSGLFSTCQFLGAAVGGIVGGYLYALGGVMLVLGCCAGLIALWGLFASSMVFPVKVPKADDQNVVA